MIIFSGDLEAAEAKIIKRLAEIERARQRLLTMVQLTSARKPLLNRNNRKKTRGNETKLSTLKRRRMGGATKTQQ